MKAAPSKKRGEGPAQPPPSNDSPTGVNLSGATGASGAGVRLSHLSHPSHLFLPYQINLNPRRVVKGARMFAGRRKLAPLVLVIVSDA
jgi:hypothetical protein